jgi:hypothetical protein
MELLATDYIEFHIFHPVYRSSVAIIYTNYTMQLY